MTRVVLLASGRTRGARAVELTALAIVAIALLGALVWRVEGGTWARVTTPSMGTAAPVGTLVWVKPVPFDELAVGDIVTFRAPGVSGTISHRVRTVHDDGTLGTAGDLSGSDPWRLGPDDVVGRVVHRWQGVGWLVAAAPVLLIGMLVLGALVRFAARPSWKQPVAIVGAALLVCVVIVVQRPLLRADQLSFVGVPEGAEATFVSSGLLPVRVSAPSGDWVDLRAGEVGSVVSSLPDAGGTYAVDVGANLPHGWWLALVLLCFLPAIGSTVRSSRTGPRPPRNG